jgi:hypothetical protein
MTPSSRLRHSRCHRHLPQLRSNVCIQRTLRRQRDQVPRRRPKKICGAHRRHHRRCQRIDLSIEPTNSFMSYPDLGQTKYAMSSADNRILTLMCCHQFCRMPTRRQPPRPGSPPTSRAVASGLLRSGKRRPHSGGDDLDERLGAMDGAWAFGNGGIRTVKSWRHAATASKDPEAG